MRQDETSRETKDTIVLFFIAGEVALMIQLGPYAALPALPVKTLDSVIISEEYEMKETGRGTYVV